MAVRSVGYVELYTGRKQATVDYFVSEMGFAHVADSVDAESSSVLLRQGSVQLIVTTGPATRDFLEAHGEGIADVALTCDDVEDTVRAAAAAGAPVTDLHRGHPSVSGFGDVVHTLLPATHDAVIARPGPYDWVAAPGPEDTRTSRIRLLDHVAVCLEGGSLEKYVEFYREAFGFSRYSSEYVDVGAHAMDSVVVRSPSEDVTFTLVAPDLSKGRGQLDAFLERNGAPGVQHLAFLVDDIISAVRDFRGSGMEFLTVPDTYYEALSERFADLSAEIGQLRSTQVLADRDEWGHLLQLFSRSPYERNTLFYELIQRRGSRGFGSANIRALYDAVERDGTTTE